jgi:ribosomal protein S27AE
MTMADNKLISRFCEKCGRRVVAGVALDHTIQFHCTKCGDMANAHTVVKYVPAPVTKEEVPMNDDAEKLRAYVHGLFYAAEKKNKSKAWLALAAARRAYKMKSVALWRGALDALINLGNS